MGRLAISPFSAWVDRIAMSIPAISFAMSASNILDMIFLRGENNCGEGVAFRIRTDLAARQWYAVGRFEQLRGMTRIDVLGRLLFALWGHLGGIRLSRHAARSEFLSLNVLFREIRLTSIDTFFGHSCSLA